MTTKYRPSSGERSHHSRFRIHSPTQNKTLQSRSKLVSVGVRKNGGIPSLSLDLNKDPVRKTAQFTVEEERAREKAMDFYRYVGKSEVEADRLACEDVKKEFSRLKECDIPPKPE